MDNQYKEWLEIIKDAEKPEESLCDNCQFAYYIPGGMSGSPKKCFRRDIALLLQ